jgi:hypothetical protein
MIATGLLSILLALVFPMERYQGFLFFRRYRRWSLHRKRSAPDGRSPGER